MAGASIAAEVALAYADAGFEHGETP